MNLGHCVAGFHSLQTLTLIYYVKIMKDHLFPTFLHSVLCAITAYNTFEHLSVTLEGWRLLGSKPILVVSDVRKCLTDSLQQALERLPKLLQFELVFKDFKVLWGFVGELEEVMIRWLPKLKNIVSVKCEY